VTANAVVAPSPGKVELQQLEVADPGPGEVQVRVHVSLISPGTERAFILAMPNTRGKFPFEPGYASAGIVEKVGTGVTNFAPGDRVGCYMLGHRSVGNVSEQWVEKMPDSVSLEHACFISLGETVQQGVRKARIDLGEHVLVLGLGLIGQIAVLVSRLSGAAPVTAVDRVGARLEIARKVGADKTIEATSADWYEHLGGEKPEVVIECTGMPDVVAPAIKAVRELGRVILLGSTRGESSVNFYADVHRRGVTLIGAHATGSLPKGGSRPGNWTWADEAQCFVRLLHLGRLNLDPLITHRVHWSKAPEMYRQILDWKTDSLGVILQWGQGPG
jgi:L-iditol 2-dehydrogenase